MKIIHLSRCTTAQNQSIQLLKEQCRQYEGILLPFPAEAGPEYFLLYEQERLISALSLFFPEPAICECSAMTAPDRRRCGYFSKLLDQSFEFLDEYEAATGCTTDFYFITDPQSGTAISTLAALETKFSHSEYLLYRSLDDAPAAAVRSVTIIPKHDGRYIAVSNQTAIGSCYLDLHPPAAYLHHLEIEVQYRRSGYGTAFLSALLTFLKQQQIHIITLQVTSLNRPAWALYKKTGFLPKETLSYYRYL